MGVDEKRAYSEKNNEPCIYVYKSIITKAVTYYIRITDPSCFTRKSAGKNGIFIRLLNITKLKVYSLLKYRNDVFQKRSVNILSE